MLTGAETQSPALGCRKEAIMRVLHFVAIPAAATLFAAAAAVADAASLPATPAPQTATAPTVQVTAPTQSTATGANKLICHQVVYDGMLVHRPQCMTAHEWEARRAMRQRELQQLQVRAASMH
jgi:hypothetical protein